MSRTTVPVSDLIRKNKPRGVHDNNCDARDNSHQLNVVTSPVVFGGVHSSGGDD